jgi:hypothetical protein
MGNGGFLYNIYGNNVNNISNQVQNIVTYGPTKQNVTAIAKQTGLVAAKTAGVAGGAIAVGAGAGAISYVLAPPVVATGTTACVSGGCQQAQKAVDYTARYGNDLGSKMNQVANNLENTEYNFGDHAIRRIAERVGVGNESKVLNTLNNAKPFEYFHDNIDKLGYYDAQARIFVGQIKSNGNITTIITNASEKYVKGLIK